MSAPDERELLEATRRLLQQSERACDEFTVARLRAARLRALDAKHRPLARSWPWAGGIFTAGVTAALAGMLWFNTASELPLPHSAEAIVGDMDLLTTESPDFYAEMEFYDWLASDPDAS